MLLVEWFDIEAWGSVKVLYLLQRGHERVKHELQCKASKQELVILSMLHSRDCIVE